MSISHFLLYLEKQIVSNSYISKVKAALVMYEDMLSMNSTSLTQHVLRILDGVKNLAVNRKSPVQKAPRLSLSTIKKMITKVISPHVTRPERVDAVKLRTVFRITVVYYTFCRYNCFSTLRAENFLDNGTEIEVFFPEQRMTPSIEETLPRWFKITLRFARCS